MNPDVFLVTTYIYIAVISANHYDPHIFPARGPFFEGWYNRLTDSDNYRSFGMIVGHVLSADILLTSYPTTYLSFFRSRGANDSMEVIDMFPQANDISVTVRGGKSVTSNPDNASPAYFEWTARPYGYFNVTPNTTVFDFEALGVRFRGKFEKPVSWAKDGRGPEGWLGDLPYLPLHWFVYSLATQGTYVWENQFECVSGKALMHQEKNWGNSFPPSWIWTEGVSSEHYSAYAGSVGLINFGPIPIPAHLYGYRNFKKNITLNFRPDNSVLTKTFDGCLGTALITIQSLTHKLVIRFAAPSATLNKCLLGPTEQGFKPVLVESFQTTVETKVYKLVDCVYIEIDNCVFHEAALEFGGNYMCSTGPCQTKVNPHS